MYFINRMSKVQIDKIKDNSFIKFHNSELLRYVRHTTIKRLI